MNVRNMRTVFLAAMVTLAAVSGLRLVADVRAGDTDAAAIWIGLLLVVVILAVVFATMSRRVVSCAARAARHRPGMVVVPGFTTAEMRDIARHQGASARGWLAMGGSPVAVVVTPTELEVWGRLDDGPRWVVQRTPDGVTDGPAVYGGREVPAVWAHDGLTAVVLVPAYRPLPAMVGRVGADVDRAVAELSGTAPVPGAG
ncbi:hypothetical protein GCM10009718_09200 [Isoptericola halotolerans]|uniref:Uncharacterized protein n=1 Tax=Isoptericola halotolerans TaxID=300560 RepID=A0ABX2A0D8_9MICO|nr:hypothetical protein [Isoptericola halotolerans]NOV96156.1 hypothetical protein [Isoptericola halotolerans]